jgi:hypothetical protein
MPHEGRWVSAHAERDVSGLRARALVRRSVNLALFCNERAPASTNNRLEAHNVCSVRRGDQRSSPRSTADYRHDKEIDMMKQLKLAAAIGALMMAAVSAPAGAAGSSPFPSQVSEVAGFFFNSEMFHRMDRNRDGMVSRAEFMDYFGRQFDRMDTGGRGMLMPHEFTSRQRMSKVFIDD